MALFESLSTKLQDITAKMRGKSRVTEQDIKDMMKEIRIALLEADVNYQVVKELTQEIGEKCKNQEVMESLTPGQQVVKIVHDSLVDILGGGDNSLHFQSSGFTVIMLYGLQGSGKTTTAAKLALHLRKQAGKKPFLVSVDTHRPAAQEQLAILAKSIDVPCYINPQEKDAVVIAREGLVKARYLMRDVMIVDTAGRMTVDDTLMRELKEIAEVVRPNEKLLIVDAMIGQEAVNVARTFDEEIGLDGFIMTKLDGDARGGAALSIYRMTQKPIKFAATGEKVDALEAFHPDRMASRILGMGDVLSLIEKAGREIDEKKAMQSINRLQNNQFTLDDMLEQFEQVQKMGSLKDILGMIPGMNNKQLANVNLDDRKLDYTKAIIRSMTAAERSNVKLLNASRRQRIAKGSGRTVQEVNQLVKQYEESLKMMKSMGLTGKKGAKGKKRRTGGFPGFNFPS
ncbi:MAG: signal recognition particle protein [Clostridiaceae bacterium]|nr:signal recognition particle protein [Clostridiaceae bacterium]